ncbi:Olfactory receptor 2L8 [Heterocephalus glaber]|uniref:Olfactory receptor 2L8 n=1 Tax=Heterocephalus glaber TaxID=10181 RepID=G5ANF2_HETGA|nr:Olfactory receptor 2L8 [Heterocephalus glaber]
MTLSGKLSTVLLILLDAHLHTPMYFLLSQISLMDLIYICTTVPKMASGSLFGNKSISFIGCGVQCFSFARLAGSEGPILMSTAYDHYMAICFPLHYAICMNRRVCVLMILGSWAMASVNSCAHTVYGFHIPYCRSRAINHFFCDIPAMVTMACGDTWVYEYTMFLSTIIFLLFPSMAIVGSALWSPAEDKLMSVFYTILTPVLNPVIYSLRNKEVQRALGRVAGKVHSTM